jgi:Flp pilus assembly pilin Flp
MSGAGRLLSEGDPTRAAAVRTRDFECSCPELRQRRDKRYAMRSMWQRMTRRLRDDRGAATAEYAIVIMAAVGFAGLLVVILRSGEVQAILTDLVQRALNSAG